MAHKMPSAPTFDSSDLATSFGSSSSSSSDTTAQTYSTCFETGGGGGGIIGNTMSYYASTIGGALHGSVQVVFHLNPFLKCLL